MTEGTSLAGIHSCSVASGVAGESPIGWAVGGYRFVLVEVPLPWPAKAKTARGMPPGLASVIDAAGWWDPTFQAVAPDPRWSVPGRTRVVLYDRSAPVNGAFTRREFVVAPAEVADLVRAWQEGSDVGEGEPGANRVRDILVCAHGSHDACCGRLGIPVHRFLSDDHTASGGAGSEVRVWRASHTGGHRFAPTMLDLPDGRSWGRLRTEDAQSVVERTAHPSTLRERYRGLGTLASFQERLVEAELLFEHGWAWTDLYISGSVESGEADVYAEEIDASFDPSVVRITATDLITGATRTYEGVVQRGGDIVTRGECRDEDWDLPTYSVTSLQTIDQDVSVR